MAEFKPIQTKIRTEPAEPAGPGAGGEARKVESGTRFDLEEFLQKDLRSAGSRSYEEVRKRYGALSPTDPDRHARSRKDARFKLNPLLKEPLAIEDEERRVIEEKVRARVAAIADEAREQAAAKGYQDGLKRGHQEAFQKFQTECAAHLTRIEALIQSFENARKDIFQANEHALIELIYQTARAVLLRELKSDREYVLRLAKELVERVGTRENIRIRIHPQDRESIEMLKSGLSESFGTLQNVMIEVSEQVRQGGCVVESEWNAINASVETQLRKIHAALLGVDGDVSGTGTGDTGGAGGGKA